MSRLDDVLERIQFARRYTLWLAEATPMAEWFEMPNGVTHLAYQLGHIVLSQYSLCLLLVRGEHPGDSKVFPPHYAELFGKLDPSPDATSYPSASEIRATLDRVHAQVLAEVPTFAAVEWDVPIPSKHRFCQTRRQFLEWCPAHEMIHAGQIGLLRRLLGYKQLW